MTLKKYLKLLCTILVLFYLCSFNVFAMNSGFNTYEYDDNNEKDDLLLNCNIAFFDIEPEKQAFTSFDVNEEGLFALASESGQRSYTSPLLKLKLVCVYNDNGVFQYGYSFYTSGDYGVEWDGNDIIIYLYRERAAILVNSSGEILEVKKFEDTYNSDYWNHKIHARKRIVNNNTYIMRNNMGIILNLTATSYSILVKIDSSGNATTLYDVSTAHTKYTILILLCLCIFFVAVATSVIYSWIHLSYKKYKKP